eukprot:5658248-Amphidinium_carterae.1
MRGWSEATASNNILDVMSAIDTKYPATLFYARVPSKSNPADEASRGGVAEVDRVFALPVEVTAPQ